MLKRLSEIAELRELTHGQMKTKGVKVSQATISRLLSGKGRTDPGIDQLMQIAAGLDVDFLALLEEQLPRRPDRPVAASIELQQLRLQVSEFLTKVSERIDNLDEDERPRSDKKAKAS